MIKNVEKSGKNYIRIFLFEKWVEISNLSKNDAEIGFFQEKVGDRSKFGI